jgi:hypothetical protein
VRAYTFLHQAVDDHSRFVDYEILPDQTKETASERFNHPARGMGLRQSLRLRDRTATYYPDFIQSYNRRKPHTALKGAPPVSRVINQPG